MLLQCFFFELSFRASLHFMVSNHSIYMIQPIEALSIKFFVLYFFATLSEICPMHLYKPHVSRPSMPRAGSRTFYLPTCLSPSIPSFVMESHSVVKDFWTSTGICRPVMTVSPSLCCSFCSKRIECPCMCVNALAPSLTIHPFRFKPWYPSYAHYL